MDKKKLIEDFELNWGYKTNWDSESGLSSVDRRDILHSELIALIEQLMPTEEKGIKPINECPFCGEDWDMDKHNSCKCGAYICKH